MHDRELYSINEVRRQHGGIARNTIYGILASGDLASMTLGSRRFIPAEAIAKFIAKSTTRVSPSIRAARTTRSIRTRAAPKLTNKRRMSIADSAA